MADSNTNRSIFYGLGLLTYYGTGADGTVHLRDAEGKIHVFPVAQVAVCDGMMESLSPRANFLIGVCWQKWHTESNFELVPKVETSALAIPAPASLQ